ncbi:MAG: esterase/lipase family protein [Oceanococcus sp.]
MKRIGIVLACCALLGCQRAEDTSAVEPELTIDSKILAAELRCTEFQYPERPPILLVHGTFTAGWEQYEWSYIPVLQELGYDVCTTTYPDRGLVDQQVSAEYVVHALRSIYQQTGRKVAMIGHSQGVSVPRWAIKWWPSAREAVDDFILIAGPNHGTVVADPLSLLSDVLGDSVPLGTLNDMAPIPAAFHQFSPDSDFITVTNLDDETPGDISYTTIYTLFDELVQPALPTPTAALEFGLGNPNVSNILLQDVCPAYVTEHALIGIADGLAFALALDAINNSGPADSERAGAADLCALPLLPAVSLSLPGLLAGGAEVFGMEFENGPPSDLHLSVGEPALRDYAQTRLDEENEGAE